MSKINSIAPQLMFGVCIATMFVCADKVGESVEQVQAGAVCRYVMDEDTARLKSEFETEWLKRVAGYTNYTTVGMAEDYAEMGRFVKEWKPRILRNQVYKVKDNCLREKMVSRMLKADSIEALYYGLLIPHQEIWDRWSAYDENANACGKLGEREVQFANGRARWMSDEFDDCEMSAVILEDCMWPSGGHDAFAFVLVDTSRNFDNPGKITSDSLVEYWLVCLQGGKLTMAAKLPVKDVLWMPNLEHAPFGRAYTVVLENDKANVVNCVSGEIVRSCPIGSCCDKIVPEEKMMEVMSEYCQAAAGTEMLKHIRTRYAANSYVEAVTRLKDEPSSGEWEKFLNESRLYKLEQKVDNAGRKRQKSDSEICKTHSLTIRNNKWKA